VRSVAVADAQPPTPAPAPSDVAPEPAREAADNQWQAVDLELVVADETDGCPSRAEIAAAIDQLTGRRFVVEGSDVVVRLSVERASGQRLHVGIDVAEGLIDGDASRNFHRLRDLEQAAPCRELLRAAALSVSLHAAPQKAPDETMQRAPSPAASATDAGSVSDTPTRSSPGETQQPSPTEPPGIPQRQPQREAPEPGMPEVPTLGIGAAPLVSVGQSPGLGVGGELQLGIGSARWAVRLGASHVRSTGTTPEPSQPAQRVLAPATDLWLAGCRGFSAGRYRACALAGYSWLHARGRGFFVNRQQLLQTPWVGAQLGASWPLNTRFDAGPRLDVLLPLRPIELRVVGQEEPLWEMSPVTVRLALELFWH